MHGSGAEGGTCARCREIDTLTVPSFDFMTTKGLAASRGLLLKISNAHHLYKVGESNSRKHVLLHQEKDVNSICVGYVIQVE